ncbi:hypothetical protein AB0J43_08310, partial [Nonomuraea fuscirosea]
MMSRLLIGRCLSALATALIPTTLTLAVLRATDDGGALGIVLASELVPIQEVQQVVALDPPERALPVHA